MCGSTYSAAESRPRTDNLAVFHPKTIKSARVCSKKISSCKLLLDLRFFPLTPTMKSYFSISVLATLHLSVQASPAAIPELQDRQLMAPVSCTANGGSVATCSTKSLTRYGCPHTDTNRCATVGTTLLGSTVSITCYQWGEVVNGNSYVTQSTRCLRHHDY